MLKVILFIFYYVYISFWEYVLCSPASEVSIQIHLLLSIVASKYICHPDVGLVLPLDRYEFDGYTVGFTHLALPFEF